MGTGGGVEGTPQPGQDTVVVRRVGRGHGPPAVLPARGPAARRFLPRGRVVLVGVQGPVVVADGRRGPDAVGPLVPPGRG